MLKKYRDLQSGEFILVGADTSMGGGDYCAAQFISKTKIDVPYVFHSPNSATEMTNEMLTILEDIYERTRVKPVIAYERNNGGVFEMERLATLNRNGKFKIFEMPQFGFIQERDEKKLGWDTNSATRPAMLQQLKDAIDHHALKLYDKATVNELFSFISVKTSSSWKAQAEANCHDDLVMALAIAWQLYQIEKPEINQMDYQARQIISQISSRGEYWR